MENSPSDGADKGRREERQGKEEQGEQGEQEEQKEEEEEEWVEEGIQEFVANSRSTFLYLCSFEPE